MRPNHGDYSDYYNSYVNLIEGDDIINILYEQNKKTQDILNSFSEHKGNYRYADGKWTVKEVVGHLIDTERVFAYRALCIARGEKKSLPGFEQDDYVKEGNFNHRELFDLNYEFRLLRESNLLLFKSFTTEMLKQKGFANESSISVLAILFIIAGHELHHIKVLQEKYI
ncbi:MAG: DinB family protein [Ignavibacteria bacterium]|nr:DinB family protein [Ignavibacteria bacterium]MBT8383020.1 DinB family protein [Ignavibacteria bacterium]MBT8391877.1 DinB family protein [Ignavibacteria bacterium]NNJ52968.1 DinB family protein [Ignavibacteriaceae bacterium]NNL21443.1 DinB family protein [Ignavibacteriaceae bacterium]